MLAHDAKNDDGGGSVVQQQQQQQQRPSSSLQAEATRPHMPMVRSYMSIGPPSSSPSSSSSSSGQRSGSESNDDDDNTRSTTSDSDTQTSASSHSSRDDDKKKKSSNSNNKDARHHRHRVRRRRASQRKHGKGTRLAVTSTTTTTTTQNEMSSDNSSEDDDDDDEDDSNTSTTTAAAAAAAAEAQSPQTPLRDARATFVSARDVDVAVAKHVLRVQQLQRYLRVCWSRRSHAALRVVAADTAATTTTRAAHDEAHDDRELRAWCARSAQMHRRHMDALVERYLAAPMYSRAHAVFCARQARHEQRLRTTTFATAYDAATYVPAATAPHCDAAAAATTAAHTSSLASSYGLCRAEVELLIADAARRLRFLDDTLPWRPIDYAVRAVALEVTAPLDVDGRGAAEMGNGGDVPGDDDEEDEEDDEGEGEGGTKTSSSSWLLLLQGAAAAAASSSSGGDVRRNGASARPHDTRHKSGSRRRRGHVRDYDVPRPLTLTAAQQRAAAALAAAAVHANTLSRHASTQQQQQQQHYVDAMTGVSGTSRHAVTATTSSSSPSPTRTTTRTTSNMVGGCINRLIEVLLLAEEDVPFAHGITDVNYTNLFLLLSSLFVMADVVVTRLIRFFRGVWRWQSEAVTTTTTAAVEKQDDDNSMAATAAAATTSLRTGVSQRHARATHLQCRVVQCLHAFCCVHEKELTLTTLQRLSYFIDTTLAATREESAKETTARRLPTLYALDTDTQAWPCSVGRYSSDYVRGVGNNDNNNNNDKAKTTTTAATTPAVTLRPLHRRVLHALTVLARYVRRLTQTHYTRVSDAQDSNVYTLLDKGVPRRGTLSIDDELQHMLRQYKRARRMARNSSSSSDDEDSEDAGDDSSSSSSSGDSDDGGTMSRMQHTRSRSAGVSRGRRGRRGGGNAAAAAVSSSSSSAVTVLPRQGWVRDILRRSPLRPTLRCFDVPAAQLANQLCLLAHCLLCDITPLELLRRVCEDSDVCATVPCHLNRLLDYTSHLQLWTAAVVVTQPRWDDCVAALQHMLHLCRLLYDRQNYEMASAVLQGLCHESVHVVERAYAELHSINSSNNNSNNSNSQDENNTDSNKGGSMLSAKAMHERSTLQSLLDPFAAYSPSSLNSITARVAGDMTTPMIPAVAPILAVLREYEVTMGKTATVRRFDGQTFVNWSKLMATGTFISLWLRCQRLAYTFALDVDLQRFVWSIHKHTWSDDMLVQVALRPKVSTSTA